MSIRSLRLPRLVESDPRGPALLEGLIVRARPIRPGSDISVPVVSFEGIGSVLFYAHQTRRVVRGLETAERTLKGEQRGLRMADRKSGAPRGERVSRLLLLANDGSAGFYRQVENLLIRHGPRVLAFRLDVGAAGLGAHLFGKGQTARLLLIQHKEAVAGVLLALADQFADS